MNFYSEFCTVFQDPIHSKAVVLISEGPGYLSSL